MDDYAVLHVTRCGAKAVADALKIKSLGEPDPKDHVTKYIVWIRNPLSRFVSAFFYNQYKIFSNAKADTLRRRFGYPQFGTQKIRNFPEVPANFRIHFLQFNTANDLAEAIYSQDDKKRKVAQNIMTAQFGHIHEGVETLLNKGDFINKHLSQIYFVGRREYMDTDIDSLCDKLGIPRVSPIPKTEENLYTPGDRKYLSDLAVRNLRKFFSKEYEFLKQLNQLKLIDNETLEIYNTFPTELTLQTMIKQQVTKSNINNIIFIHVGKTGGTTLGRYFNIQEIHMKVPIHKEGMKYITWVRNPIERIVSSFNMAHYTACISMDSPELCKRLGIPYSSPLIKRAEIPEGVVSMKDIALRDILLKFDSVNEFAEALGDFTNPKNPAAQRFYTLNQHVNMGYGFYFIKGAFIQRYHADFIFVGRQEFMKEDVDNLCNLLGVDRFENLTKWRENKYTPKSKRFLSQKALTALRHYYAGDFEALREMNRQGLIDNITYESYLEYPQTYVSQLPNEDE